MTPTKRAHERYEIAFPVVVTHGEHRIDCVSKNVSLGGMFVICPVLVKFGELVTMQFHLPSLPDATTMQARVRWTTEEGFGVQFGSLRAIEVWGLNQLVRRG